MSIGRQLAEIVRGRRGEALLHTCRLEGWGGEFYGEEAVLEAFRARPCELADAEAFEGDRQAALFGSDAALFADVVDGRVSRLWHVGQGLRVAAEPKVAVAFDPDLSQARGAVFLRAEDHPGLDAALLQSLENVGRDLIGAEQGLRARAFLLRAETAGPLTVALFAIYRLGTGPVRDLGFIHGLVRIRSDAGCPIACRTWVDRLDVPTEPEAA